MFVKCYFRCWENSSAQDDGPALGDLNLVSSKLLLPGKGSVPSFGWVVFDYRNE